MCTICYKLVANLFASCQHPNLSKVSLNLTTPIPPPHRTILIMKRAEIVNKIAHELKLFVPEAETILYGSEARGDSRSNSDIDILILLPDCKDSRQYVLNRSEISGRLYELSLELGVDISPLILPQEVWKSRKTPFTVNVMNEGIRI